MKDFLSNLVDRALNHAPTVQRRRPSIFEPMPGAGGASVPDLHEPAQPTDEADWREASTEHGTGAEGGVVRPAHPAAVPRQPTHPLAFAGERPVELPPPLRPPTSRPTVLQVPSADTRAVPPVGEHPVVEQIVPAAERSSAQKWANLLPERVIERIFEREVVLPAASGRVAPTPERPAPGAAPPRREQGPAVPDADRARPGKRPRGDGDAASATPLPPPKPSPQPEPIKPARPAAKAPPPPTTVRERAPAAPSVHVSIGRIEVSAAGAPPAGREKPKAAPRLSLDDYLHARSGGRP